MEKDIGHFCGATNTPVLDFLRVSKPELAALFTLGGCVCVASGATPADLLVTSMAAEPFSATYLQA